jgi:hypothetical protein
VAVAKWSPDCGDTVVLLVEPERLGGAARVYLNLPDIDNLDLGEPV